ncbi:hypothetical protein [Lignipirellula cremea]|uniref:Uncharacterized protein n=1 Tax=Lignipirellula cremea TaxID=2528010 RepID=A0A518E4H4_9BACT|nr:hypothetical protein [Lignipirellula cremea]QDU98996.1 hypothetical protein Pla8534_69070 [Lignipirellula cremea]
MNGASSSVSTADSPGERPSADQAFWLLALLAGVSTCLYGIINWLSWRCDDSRVPTERPILALLVLFAAAFLAYLMAIRLASRAAPGRRLMGLIVGSAVLFRVVLLFSAPIQEVDIYRYLWDGAASCAGVNPFRYSPQQVRLADSLPPDDPALVRLVAVRDNRPALAQILRRVHFGELPTIYPPTSQAVFAAATAITPARSSVLSRIFIMKAWWIGFDLATLGLVIALLKLTVQPVGRCLIYAWCPLLLKEVANSGHLDAAAVFLTTLAVYLAARLVVKPIAARDAWSTTGQVALVGFVLALAVGAKLYPVVLAPLLCLVLARQMGWRRLLLPAAIFSATTLLLLWPMLPRETAASAESPAVAPALAPLPASAVVSGAAIDPSLGVATFLRRWEMNDFLFLILVENLKSTAEPTPQPAPWFSVLPESWRRAIVDRFARVLQIEPYEAPFLLTRAITGALFCAIAILLAWRAARRADLDAFLTAGFLTLAWFWLLCPTQNPWYWTWTLPLLPFARSRAWLAMSGLALLYYLRFWLLYHWPDAPVLGTPYPGAEFFDFVVTWIEFAPWLLCLAGEYILRRRSKKPDTPGTR